ncbi:MAG: NAD(P)-dependent glycerol-3-phosphate dehydrogenase [Desulfobacteraceae bacterium]|nr:NAD(P)-dependent glycerol-3-phosphate dehydrogenase [Desulfobacteraceae bacterium]MBU4001674.1 NAD(P)-dependent glycerol-3-phosphate dehydrogenase [Pseudomonadota bacterium]MBU4054618.1 NAD(P)-dependent glycerol-3-phosphate dehydrogenase [Pseudomonadota bacterium]
MKDPDILSTKIGVVGGGSWGTALADLLASKGFPVDLWIYESEVVEQIKTRKENSVFLPGFPLSANLFPTNDLSKVVSNKDLVVMVTPSHLVRTITGDMAPFISAETIMVSASKGIEIGTHLTMSQVIHEKLPFIDERRLTVLSGPTFAKEVASRMPTGITVAAKDPEVAEFVQKVFATPYFRVYTHDDLMGVELGGAVKNVIAISAGIVDGLKLGNNTRAILITRGLAEIRRLGLRLGANPDTFMGLAGMGDLLLTCTGDLSRNHTVGKKIGEGHRLKDVLAEMRMVAEGVKTAKSVYNLSKKLDVDMPICHATYHVLYDDLSPTEALYQLMTRDLKSELDDSARGCNFP